MPSWLCKIWRLIVNIVDKVLKVIVGAVKALLDVAVAALDSLLDSIGGSNLLLWLALGLGAWFLLGATDGDDDQPSGNRLQREGT